MCSKGKTWLQNYQLCLILMFLKVSLKSPPVFVIIVIIIISFRSFAGSGHLAYLVTSSKHHGRCELEIRRMSNLWNNTGTTLWPRSSSRFNAKVWEAQTYPGYLHIRNSTQSWSWIRGEYWLKIYLRPNLKNLSRASVVFT